MKKAQFIEYEEKLTARRYAELLTLSCSALETSLLIYKLNAKRSSCIKDEIKGRLLLALPTRANCHIISLDYAISALGAFINHLGFIFCDNWIEHEKSNFWVQYEIVILHLLNIGISIHQEIHATPYSSFKNDRSKRNNIHHPHASKHDHYYKNGIIVADTQDMKVSLQIFSETWVTISYKEAKLTYDNVKKFIEKIHVLIKQTEIKIPNHQGGIDLLNDFLGDDPFKRALLSGVKKLKSTLCSD